MNNRKKSKRLIFVSLMTVATLIFSLFFTCPVYAVPPEEEKPVYPMDPEPPAQPDPVPQPTPQPQPQPTPQPQPQPNANNNQPAQPEEEEKTDTRLIGLSIECGELSPEFSSEIYSYTVYVRADAENKSCKVYAEAADSENTKITVKGPKKFGNTNTKKTVTIKAEDGGKSKYVINIHVLKDSEILVGNTLVKLANPEDVEGVCETIKDGIIPGGSVIKYIAVAAALMLALLLSYAGIKAIRRKKGLITECDDESTDILETYSEVIVLDYIDAFKIRKGFRAPSYFNEELKTGDVRRFLRKLEKKNYIEYVEDGYIVLTSEGEKLREYYSDYIEFFALALPEISAIDYQQMKDSDSEDESFEKTVIRLILKKCRELSVESDSDALKKLHHTAGKLYSKIEFDGQAMYHYLEALYLDVNDVSQSRLLLDISEGKLSAESAKVCFEDIYISPYIVSDIHKLGEVYYDEMLYSVYENNKQNNCICGVSLFKSLVQDIISGNFSMDKWQGTLRSAFDKAADEVFDKNK